MVEIIVSIAVKNFIPSSNQGKSIVIVSVEGAGTLFGNGTGFDTNMGIAIPS